MGPDFLVDARLVMSDRNFLEYFPNRGPQADRIELGLIKLAPGADLPQVKRAVARILPADARVFNKQELIDIENAYIAKNLPVGVLFMVGMVVGFMVGVIICYQILFNEITDHQAEFATLKAIGHTGGYLVRVVLSEGLYLSLLAFLPALLVSLVFYTYLQEVTGIAMYLTALRAAVIGAMTVCMCVISAMAAVTKVLRSDPADVFG